MRRLVAAVVLRAEALEAVLGLGLLATGTALVLSLGAALVVLGAALYLPTAWSVFGRRP